MIRPISKNIAAYKPKPLPKGLIYHSIKDDFYYLIERKTGKLVAEMNAYSINSPTYTCYDITPEEKVFHIGSLEVMENEQGKGWGKFLINFAKNLSLQNGCKGRISLIAYNPDKPPHIFYKKQGFEAVDDFNEKILNEYARVNIKPQYLKAMDMYLPVAHSKKGLPFGVNKQEHEGLFIRFINWLLK